MALVDDMLLRATARPLRAWDAEPADDVPACH